MYRNHTIGVIVPAYNEKELIGATLDGIPPYVDKIYAVDDASKDETLEIIENFQVKDKRIVCLSHEQNRGVGGAIITGYKAALNDGIDIMAVMAGDNQMDPGQLVNLLDPIVDGKADYTKGNRLLSRDFMKGMSRVRQSGNILLTFLNKVGSGYWHVVDPQNGYTAISKRVFDKIPPDSIFPWYGYCNDLLVRLNVYDFRVMDCPIPARYGREKSKIRYSTYIPRVSWLLLKDFCWRLKVKYVVTTFNPLVLFYLAGVFLTSLGIVAGGHTLYRQLTGDGPLFVRATLSLLLFMQGLQFMLLAMWFDMQASSEHQKNSELNKPH